MPLPERLILPVNVSRGTLQCPVPDELEGVTNGTLANIIRQLSNLSRHAEEMFGNLFREAEDVATRSSGLQARIDRLAVQVTQLDSTVEEVSLQDIHLRKAFRSSQTFDQQVVSRDTMPKAMLEAYLACDKPPPLDKLNPYREDGKDGLKFYTDPNYFFELWKQEMLKDTERMMHDRGKKHSHSQVGEKTENEPGKSNNTSGIIGNGGSGQKAERNKKRVRQPQNTTEKQRQKIIGQGEFINDYDHQQPYHNEDKNSSGIVGYDPALMSPPSDLRGQNQQLRPNSIDINKRPSYQGYQYNANQEPIYTPRILRTEQPSSPQHHQMNYQQQQQQQQQLSGMYQYQQQHDMFNQEDMLSAQQQAMDAAYGGNVPYHNDQQFQQPGTPTRRPNQPPPAPPPGMGADSPTRQSRGASSQRDSLPPPPPPPANEMQTSLDQNHLGGYGAQQQQSPMQQVMNQLNSQHHHHPHQNAHNSPQHQQHNSRDVDLPPPPPVPNNNGSSNTTTHLNARIPPEHLPPSPPPPPPDPSSNGLMGHGSPVAVKVGSGQFNSGGGPPPPPPPPPMSSGEIMNGFRNGDVYNNKSSPSKTNGSPPKSITSPQGVKKPVAPKHLAPQDGVRSDLLKAIRDGIALRKVEQNQQAKEEEKAGGGQSDVASILARRVAVEMSDSDEAGGGGGVAPSDSEYDSDDWGDESTA